MIKRKDSSMEFEELKNKLQEAESTLHAIMNGEVDALVLNSPEGAQIYTLNGAEQAYHILVDSLNEGAVTISSSEIILYCNKRFADLVDYPLEEIMGKPISNFVDKDITQFLDPNYKMKSKASSINLCTLNNKFVSTLLSVSPVVFNDFKGYGLLFTDITEHLEITKEKLKLASIVEASDDGIYSLSTEGEILSWNNGAEEIYGFKAEEIIGQSIKKLIPEEKYDEHSSILKMLSSGTSIRHFETIRKKKNGILFDVSLTISILNDNERKIYGYAVTARDITDKKKNEEQIKKMNEELEIKVQERTQELKTALKDVEAFSYSVSHDLRAPLRRIEGFSKIIEQKYINELDNQAHELFKFIVDNVDKMSSLIEDLLAFSHLTKKTVEKQTVDNTKLVKRIIDEMKPYYENRVINFNVNELPQVYCDQAMMKQVWTNLISNAIKFTRYKKEANIFIYGELKWNEYIFNIADNGAGFDMKYADRLFTVFQRLHSEQEFDGTGVGLALVERIISKHGGKIWAEGKPDEGARFFFTLPASIV